MAEQVAGVFVPRGLQLAVMRAIEALGRDASGVAIQAHLEGNLGAPIPPAQVYLAVSRLRARGLIEPVARQRGGEKGAPRQPYELSGAGREALDAAMMLLGVKTNGEPATAKKRVGK